MSKFFCMKFLVMLSFTKTVQLTCADVLLQAFHLSKPKKGPTYIWADTGRQRYHDSFSSKHGDAGREGSDSGESHEPSRKQIPARHTIHGSNPLQQALHGEDGSAYAKAHMGRGVHRLHIDVADAMEHSSHPRQDQKAVQLQLCVSGLTSESVSRMLAVHARTERRAQSLVDKVHALRRDCDMLLTALPQHVIECMSP